MPPRRQQSTHPSKASLKEPGIRLCPHTCPNPGQKCDREKVWGKAGNACRRHASNEGLHPHCKAPCPAHPKCKHRILDRKITHAEWMALSTNERNAFKERYLATTPPIDSEHSGKGEQADEDQEEEQEEQDEYEQVSLPLFLLLYVFAFIF